MMFGIQRNVIVCNVISLARNLARFLRFFNPSHSTGYYSYSISFPRASILKKSYYYGGIIRQATSVTNVLTLKMVSYYHNFNANFKTAPARGERGKIIFYNIKNAFSYERNRFFAHSELKCGHLLKMLPIISRFLCSRNAQTL